MLTRSSFNSSKRLNLILDKIDMLIGDYKITTYQVSSKDYDLLISSLYIEDNTNFFEGILYRGIKITKRLKNG